MFNSNAHIPDKSKADILADLEKDEVNPNLQP